MTSKDMYLVVNDEQSFRLYVVDQFGKMNTRMDKLESRMDTLEAEVQDIRAEVRTVQDEQRLMRQSIDSLQTSVYWVLGAIGIFLAALGIFLPLYLTLKDSRKEKSDSSTTVITLPQPQVDINAIARQVGEIFGLTPKN